MSSAPFNAVPPRSKHGPSTDRPDGVNPRGSHGQMTRIARWCALQWSVLSPSSIHHRDTASTDSAHNQLTMHEAPLRTCPEPTRRSPTPLTSASLPPTLSAERPSTHASYAMQPSLHHSMAAFLLASLLTNTAVAPLTTCHSGGARWSQSRSARLRFFVSNYADSRAAAAAMSAS